MLCVFFFTRGEKKELCVINTFADRRANWVSFVVLRVPRAEEKKKRAERKKERKELEKNKEKTLPSENDREWNDQRDHHGQQ